MSEEYRIFTCYKCGKSLKNADRVRKCYVHYECSETKEVLDYIESYKKLIAEFLQDIDDLMDDQWIYDKKIIDLKKKWEQRKEGK